MLVKTKKCSHCWSEKPLDQFYKNRTKRLGVNDNCKVCQNIVNTESKRRMALESSNEFKWICNNGHVNILDYDPTVEKQKWDYRECVKCKSSF